jgi:hypothetical protein
MRAIVARQVGRGRGVFLHRQTEAGEASRACAIWKREGSDAGLTECDVNLVLRSGRSSLADELTIRDVQKVDVGSHPRVLTGPSDGHGHIY